MINSVISWMLFVANVILIGVGFPVEQEQVCFQGLELFYREMSCVNETRSDHFSLEMMWDGVIPGTFHPVT